MSSHEKTLKLVMNLDRPAVEARIADVRKLAQASKLDELAGMFNGVEGMPRAQMETRVQNALKWLKGKPEHQNLQAQLELVELNLPNLK
jgi:CTP:molybdopterin cytidylyltransferase MocA